MLDAGDPAEYQAKERAARADTHLPPGSAVLFLEITVGDASEFEDVVEFKGVEVGKYHVLRAESSSVPNAIALGGQLAFQARALFGHVRDRLCHDGEHDGEQERADEPPAQAGRDELAHEAVGIRPSVPATN